MDLVTRFWADCDKTKPVLRWMSTGELLTADELDQLYRSAYIYKSTRDSTLAAIEAEALLPRCGHCGALLKKV